MVRYFKHFKRALYKCRTYWIRIGC
ncbi:hypothetical protein MTR67_031736 [Solanum verrucosum]|uniref:Uncharacterized protein n=1 Tax=Solanum verrucosum TaxID=315347 RepID=A0AAF0U356_SOLVR|nr:hypothetical protein MTR67_031736 [Solanum verrucosum]